MVLNLKNVEISCCEGGREVGKNIKVGQSACERK